MKENEKENKRENLVKRHEILRSSKALVHIAGFGGVSCGMMELLFYSFSKLKFCISIIENDSQVFTLTRANFSIEISCGPFAADSSRYFIPFDR